MKRNADAACGNGNAAMKKIADGNANMNANAGPKRTASEPCVKNYAANARKLNVKKQNYLEWNGNATERNGNAYSVKRKSWNAYVDNRHRDWRRRVEGSRGPWTTPTMMTGPSAVPSQGPGGLILEMEVGTMTPGVTQEVTQGVTPVGVTIRDTKTIGVGIHPQVHPQHRGVTTITGTTPGVHPVGVTPLAETPLQDHGKDPRGLRGPNPIP